MKIAKLAMETIPPCYENDVIHSPFVRESRFVDHVTRYTLHDPRDQFYEVPHNHDSCRNQILPPRDLLRRQPVMAPYSDAEKRRPYDGRSDTEFPSDDYNELYCTRYLQRSSCQYNNVQSPYITDQDQTDFINNSESDELVRHPHSRERDKRLVGNETYQQTKKRPQSTNIRSNETDYISKNRNDLRTNIQKQRTSTPNHNQWNSYHIDDTTRHSFPTDYGHDRWQQWPWTSHSLYPSAACPSSPLDSGLSSQSLASSPSFERVPTPPPCVFMEQVSAFHNVRQDRKRYSCLFDSLADYNRFHTPVLRSDSGRSSPWAHSTVSRISAFTQLHRCNCNSSVEQICGRHSDGFHNNLPLPSRSRSEQEVRNVPLVSSGCEGEFRHFHQPITPKIRMYGRDPFSMPISKQEDQRHAILSPQSLLASSEDSVNSSIPEDQIDSNELNTDQFDVTILSSSTQISVSDSSSNSPRSTTTTTENQIQSPAFWNHESRDLENTEKALDELEEIYQNLKLDDYDLLDRAERRDLPTCHQLARDPFPLSRLTRSKSDSLCETTAYRPFDTTEWPQRPPRTRRAGVPDRIADDMALRKYHKPVTKPAKRNDKLMSYMLCSAPFTPTVPVSNGLNFLNQPDVELDDLSNRRYFQSSANKQDPPQPPFGIPLHPVTQRASSNYLRIRPSSNLQPLCHPRGNPDVIRDDMAFRNLRKDNPEKQQ